MTRGILGTAFIQSFLAGIGLFAAGVPAFGLWTLLVLLLAVVQLPTVLVLVPIIDLGICLQLDGSGGPVRDLEQRPLGSATTC